MAVASPEDPKTTASAPAAKGSRAGFLRRLSVGGNVALQMLLLAFILLAVNGYAFKHYHRFDFSRDSKYALSDRTKQLLASLPKPVKIIVFMGRSILQPDAANLVEEYRVANPDKVIIENVDPYRNVGRASEIQNKYKLARTDAGVENVIILDYEGRSKIISDNKLAEFDNSGAQFNQQATITAFIGEQAVTSGLLEVTEEKKNNIYYVQGHGEGSIGEGKTLVTLGQLLDNEHVAVQEVNLLNVQTVPADTGVLMILGARLDYTDREIKLLEDYWTKGGRLLLMLDPNGNTPHLTEFLARLGIRPDNNRVMAIVPLSDGRDGIVTDVFSKFVGGTLIAKRLTGVNVPLVGATQTLTLEADKVASAGTRVEPLLEALQGYWGEVDYQNPKVTGIYFDKGKDKEAPLFVAATVQKGAVVDQRVQATSGRMVVVGNLNCIETPGITQQSASLFVGSLNWLLERESLISIAPKMIKTFTLSLPEEQIRLLFWLMILAIPGVSALLGVAVWWRRRA